MTCSVDPAVTIVVMAIYSAWLKPTTILAVAGPLVAALTLAIMIIWRIRDKRRRMISYWTSATSLLADAPPHTSGGALEVTYAGKPIRDPYLMTLRVDMRGPGDISNNDFNGGDPLTFRFDVPLVAAVDEALGVEDGDLSLATGTLRIGPRLIRKGLVARIQLVTDGKPDVAAESSLINIPVLKLTTANQGDRLKRILTWAGLAFAVYYVATTPHGLVGLGNGMASFLNDLRLTPADLVVLAVQLIVLVVVLLAHSESVIRRWLDRPVGPRGDPGGTP